MTACEKKVLPVFNRLLIFATLDNAYHGHPDPLTCPPDRARRSMALYYYTVEKPEGAEADHTTVFKARPGEAFNSIGPPGAQALGAARHLGRLARSAAPRPDTGGDRRRRLLSGAVPSMCVWDPGADRPASAIGRAAQRCAAARPAVTAPRTARSTWRPASAHEEPETLSDATRARAARSWGAA